MLLLYIKRLSSPEFRFEYPEVHPDPSHGQHQSARIQHTRVIEHLHQTKATYYLERRSLL